MPRVLIITPAKSSSIPFLRESALGLRDSLEQSGTWEADWRIEIDGTDVDLGVLEDLELELSGLMGGSPCQQVRVSEHGFQATASITRSIAFFSHEAPRPDWTLTLDADDILMPGAFASISEAISASPECRYVAGGIIKAAPNEYLNESPTVLDGGTLWEGPVPQGMLEVSPDDWRYLSPLIATGKISPGGILDAMEIRKRFPVFAGCVCYRSDAIFEAGGWPGTPTGADAALLAAVSERHPGFVVDEPLIAYRQHPEQNTRSLWFLKNREVTWKMISAASRRPGISLEP